MNPTITPMLDLDITGQAMQNIAFNSGCDARLAGDPSETNPYTTHSVPQWSFAWLSGWRHVDRHWGEMARWPIRELPPVRNNLPGRAVSPT